MLRALLLTTLVGCGSDASIALLFPNAAALEATKRVRIELHDPEGAQCLDFAERVADGRLPRGSESNSADVTAPFEDVDVEGTPNAAQVVLAWAFTDTDREAPPFLAGCTDDYDPQGKEGESDDVPLLLHHIPYATLRIREASGNRQAGRPGETLRQPLRVIGEATVDGRTFVVPGLEVSFATNPPFSLTSGTARHETLSGPDGIAETTVRLPPDPAIGSIRATSPQIDNLEVTFTVSAIDELRLESRTVTIPFDATPVALAAADIDSDGVDLIALGEDGGSTRLLVADRPLQNPVVRPVPQDLGTAPIGVAVLDGWIAIGNARIVSRENAEVRLLRYSAQSQTIEPDQTHVLTASNAVALTTFGRVEVGLGLAIATTGRSTNTQPCTTNGCPSDCPAGEICGQDGVCRAHDGEVVLLTRSMFELVRFAEEQRCEQPDPVCDLPDRVTCCLSNEPIACQQDDCGCQIPRRARLGTLKSPLDPRSIAAAPFRSSSVSDLVVATQAGLHRLEQSPAGFEDEGVFLLSPHIVAAVAAHLDPELDANADLVWIEDAPCDSFGSIQAICPVAYELADVKGCLGIMTTERSGALPDLDPPDLGSCRRLPLARVPAAICLARLDEGERTDLVLSAPSDGRILVFLGDDLGGFLDPPQEIEAPAGPMVCADFDGDVYEEIVIADRTQPGRFTFIKAR